VTATVLAMFPADGSLHALWTDDAAPLETAGISGESRTEPAASRTAWTTVGPRWLLLVLGLVTTALGATARRPRVFSSLR
jgi:hypothetical protein